MGQKKVLASSTGSLHPASLFYAHYLYLRKIYEQSGEPGRLWSRAHTDDVYNVYHKYVHGGHCSHHQCPHTIKATQALPLWCLNIKILCKYKSHV